MDESKDFKQKPTNSVEPGRRHAAPGFEPRQTIVKPRQKAHHPQIQDVKSVAVQKKRAENVPKPALPRTEKSKVLRRQMVERAKQQRQKTRKNYGKHALLYLAIGGTIIAACLIVWAFQGLLPSSFQIFSDKKSQQPVNKPIIQETSSLDETQPSAEEISMHKMGVDEPRVLKIPKLNVEARVKRVGVSLSGEPIAPGNIFDVGWFEAGGRPEVDGAVLLNGHIAGPTKSGSFSELYTLKPGDTILLDRGDGTELTYTVVKVQEYASNSVDMNAATQPIDPSRKGLNLMTTVNKHIGRSDQPDKRVVVFALQ